MKNGQNATTHDFKGLGFSKLGYFKEVRSRISELERLNTELARRHNQLEAIFDSMSEGLTILDRDLNIVFANRLQKKMFPEISLIGQKCYKLFYRREKICRDCPALNTMETGETLRGEIMIREGELAGHTYEWATSPIKNPVGNVDEVILIMNDITERKNYEFKIMQSDKMAAIGFLAAGVAHEINNPLTSIAGFSEGLLKRLSKMEELRNNKMLESFREYLEIIHNEAYRCKDIARNLMEFSRSSTDDYDIIEIDQVINDTMSMIRQHAKDNNIKIIFKNHLAKGFNKVMGNESQLNHVFLSLFNSAFRAMKDGGVLSAEAKNEGNRIQIRISDTGSGYAQESLSRAFDPSCMSKQMDGGSTLDLSICYSIIKSHKGEFKMNRIEGKGSTVTLTFQVHFA
jgi:PAS domain S-box-containing protein